MTIAQIRIVVLSLAVLVFITSCQKEEFENETFNEQSATPTLTPFSAEELENNIATVTEDIETKVTSEVSITWAATDGYYFERIGNVVYGNPDTGDAEEYSIWSEDDNFLYITSTEVGGVYIALPKWGIDVLRVSYIYDFDAGGWITDKEFRYAIQESDDDIILYYSSITPSLIRFGWYIGTSSTYADYRHDIFVDGEKIEENHTFAAARNYFHIYSLVEETTYDIKIVAKDQSNGANLRIKNFTITTPKEILISDFEFRVSNITDTSVTLSWTIPDVLNSSSEIERFSVGFGSNRLGAFMGHTVGIDTEVTIHFLFNEEGEINGIYSPETVGFNSSIPGYTNMFSISIPKSTALLMNVTAIVPSDNPDEPYYTEYKRVTADDFIQLLD